MYAVAQCAKLRLPVRTVAGLAAGPSPRPVVTWLGKRETRLASMHSRNIKITVPFAVFAIVLLSLPNSQSSAVADPADESGAKSEVDTETQLNALRVYYAAKSASEEQNVAEAFEKNLQNVTFANDESKKKSFELAFASACASGEIPVDIFLSLGTDVNGEPQCFVSMLHSCFMGIADISMPFVPSSAVMDGQEEGSEGFTALMWAVYGGHEHVINTLLDKVRAMFLDGCCSIELRPIQTNLE